MNSIREKFSLKDKVAVVTGGGRGIGRAIALALAEAGATVVPTSRTQEEVDSVAKEIEKLGQRALPIVTDVSAAESVKALVEKTLKTFGKIDILVNGAGISPVWKRIEELTESEWDRILSVNLKGVFLCSREVGKAMIARQSGSIISIASISGFTGTSHMGAYSVSKAGVMQLTRVLAMEWAKHSIRVNTIAPGWVKTQMSAGVLSHEKISQSLLAQVPMKRAAEPEEIAGMAVYLASEASSFVTGQVFIVDGGQAMR
ncbi:glucose 1-dehydrogenase [Candidatus Acetothermia bacterium]|nr:glucose 1-dehydrogenase [Candidatus Acetothermia bacterium]